MDINEIAAGLRAAGFEARIELSQDPETEDDAIHVSDEVHVQVGLGGLIVNRWDQAGMTMYHSAEHRGMGAALLADVRSALEAASRERSELESSPRPATMGFPSLTMKYAGGDDRLFVRPLRALPSFGPPLVSIMSESEVARAQAQFGQDLMNNAPSISLAIAGVRVSLTWAEAHSLGCALTEVAQVCLNG